MLIIIGVPNTKPPSAACSEISTIVDSLIPIIRTGTVATIPAKGPAIPISKSALFVDMGDFIFMKAPKVPIGEINGGAGMK